MRVLSVAGRAPEATVRVLTKGQRRAIWRVGRERPPNPEIIKPLEKFSGLVELDAATLNYKLTEEGRAVFEIIDQSHN